MRTVLRSTSPARISVNTKSESNNTGIRWKDLKKQREFLDKLGSELQIDTLDDWYQIKREDVITRGGSYLITHKYQGSLSKALQSVYPEHNWQQWKFSQVPRGFWNDLKNQKQFLDHLKQELKLQKWEDWYSLKESDIAKFGGSSLLGIYASTSTGTIHNMLQTLYPEYPWQPWKFWRVPDGFWQVPYHQRQFLDWAAQQLNLKSHEDWYSVNAKTISDMGGAHLLLVHGSSLPKLLQSVYKDDPWNSWKFRRVSSGYWKSPENQKQYFDWAFQELKMASLDDWYTAKVDGLPKLEDVLAEHNGSLIKALCTVYKDHRWKIWKFSRVPNGYWEDKSTHKNFFDEVAIELGIQTLDDWYRVPMTDVAKKGGSTLLGVYYNHSLATALMKVYSSHPWAPWKFRKAPIRFWNQKENVAEYLSWLADQLGIKQLDDWHLVTHHHIKNAGGAFLLEKYGGLSKLLQAFYPEYPWHLRGNKLSKTQEYLWKVIRQLFPNTVIHREYRSPKLLFKDTNREMVLDFYFPEFRLVLEYQGEQHYFFNARYGAVESQRARDEEKRQSCEANGITVISIPFWWDRQRPSLLGTIHQHRPDLVKDIEGSFIGTPISHQMPVAVQKQFRKYTINPEYGQGLAGLTPFLGGNVAGCFLSPLDHSHLRAFWDGESTISTARSRSTMVCPSFARLMPKSPVDALIQYELLLVVSLNRFRELVPTVEALFHVLKDDEYWKQRELSSIQVVVLDVPSQSHLTFQQRLNYLQSTEFQSQLPKASSAVRIEETKRIGNVEGLLREACLGDLDSFLLRTSESFYRDPSSLFSLEVGSASSLINFKNHLSQEAAVIEVNNGNLKCKLTQTREIISLRTNKNLAIGTIVSVQFSNGWRIDSISLEEEAEIASTMDPFVVEQGHEMGGFPKCRGCFKVFTNREELRLRIKGVYTPVQNHPHPMLFRTCLDLSCVKKASERYSKRINTGVHFPSFQNRIVVPQNIRKTLHSQQELQRAKDNFPEIAWITQIES